MYLVVSVSDENNVYVYGSKEDIEHLKKELKELGIEIDEIIVDSMCG